VETAETPERQQKQAALLRFILSDAAGEDQLDAMIRAIEEVKN
jgi:hypothetical protein